MKSNVPQCTGCKAVDFVVVASGSRKVLWLVEVKDYRRHTRTKAIDLPREVALTIRDSLRQIFRQTRTRRKI